LVDNLGLLPTLSWPEQTVHLCGERRRGGYIARGEVVAADRSEFRRDFFERRERRKVVDDH
jgi:hypothetical protein